MKNVVLLLVGLVLVGLGGYRQFVQPAVSEADRIRCEGHVRVQNEGNAEALATLLPKCADPGMVAMMDAQASGSGAQAAAQSIAAANTAQSSAAMIDYALIGVGIALLLGAAMGRRRTA